MEQKTEKNYRTTLYSIFTGYFFRGFIAASNGAILLFCRVYFNPAQLGGSGKYINRGSLSLIMMILSGAIFPVVQSKPAGIQVIHSSYTGLACLMFFARKASVLKTQGINAENNEIGGIDS